MKKLLILLGSIQLLIMTGCQEINITDPALTESLSKNELPQGESRGIFPIEGLIEVRGLDSTQYYISGIIGYTHKLIITDPIPPAPQYYVSLAITINASLTDEDFPSPNNLSISGCSRDIFYVSEEGIYLLERTYKVSGADIRLSLVCGFLVATDGVGLNGIWLTILED